MAVRAFHVDKSVAEIGSALGALRVFHVEHGSCRPTPAFHVEQFGRVGIATPSLSINRREFSQRLNCST